MKPFFVCKGGKLSDYTKSTKQGVPWGKELTERYCREVFPTSGMGHF